MSQGNNPKFCTECGAAIQPTDKFCAECGVSISRFNISSEANPPFSKSIPSQPTIALKILKEWNKFTSRSKIIIGICIAAVLVTLFFMFGFNESNLFSNITSTGCADRWSNNLASSEDVFLTADKRYVATIPSPQYKDVHRVPCLSVRETEPGSYTPKPLTMSWDVKGSLAEPYIIAKINNPHDDAFTVQLKWQIKYNRCRDGHVVADALATQLTIPPGKLVINENRDSYEIYKTITPAGVYSVNLDVEKFSLEQRGKLVELQYIKLDEKLYQYLKVHSPRTQNWSTACSPINVKLTQFDHNDF